MLGFTGIVQSGKQNLLLDTYSGAAAAYSLRKLRTSYTGSAVRVRRSTDSVEQDIGFDANGNLNESTLQTFCGENLVQYSEQFDNATWIKQATNLSPNVTSNPVGVNTADSLTENTSTETHGIYQTINAQNNIYNYSLYVKNNGRQYVQLSLISQFNGSTYYRYYVIFDILNGNFISTYTVGSPQNVSYSITASGNGWYRISASILGYLNLTLYASLQISNSQSPTRDISGDIIYTGDGTSGIYLWGAQLNTGSLKPYVQTTTAALDGMGYVTKWYDQSGNARDAAQTTASSQPRLVNAGVVEKVNGKPSVRFDGSDDYISFSHSSFKDYTALSLFLIDSPFVSQVADTVGLIRIYFGDGSIRALFLSNNTGLLSGEKATIGFYDNTTNGRLGASTYAFNSGSLYLENLNLTTNSVKLFKNGSQATLDLSSGITTTSNITPSATGSTSTTIYINAGVNSSVVSAAASGFFSEWVLYPSDQSTSRTAIESNINTYYSIY